MPSYKNFAKRIPISLPATVLDYNDLNYEFKVKYAQNMKGDFSDVRFVDSDGQTFLEQAVEPLLASQYDDISSNKWGDNILSNPGFTTTSKWTVNYGVQYDTGRLKIRYASGNGSFVQAQADLVEPLVAGETYCFSYTATGACFQIRIPTSVATELKIDRCNQGLNKVTFTAVAGVTDFTVEVFVNDSFYSIYGSDYMYLDNVSLKKFLDGEHHLQDGDFMMVERETAYATYAGGTLYTRVADTAPDSPYWDVSGDVAFPALNNRDSTKSVNIPPEDADELSKPTPWREFHHVIYYSATAEGSGSLAQLEANFKSPVQANTTYLLRYDFGGIGGSGDMDDVTIYINPTFTDEMVYLETGIGSHATFFRTGDNPGDFTIHISGAGHFTIEKLQIIGVGDIADRVYRHFWVKVPSKPAAGKTIYMLYGYTNATMEDDWANTFVYKKKWHDGEDDNLDGIDILASNVYVGLPADLSWQSDYTSLRVDSSRHYSYIYWQWEFDTYPWIVRDQGKYWGELPSKICHLDMQVGSRVRFKTVASYGAGYGCKFILGAGYSESFAPTTIRIGFLDSIRYNCGGGATHQFVNGSKSEALSDGIEVGNQYCYDRFEVRRPTTSIAEYLFNDSLESTLTESSPIGDLPVGVDLQSSAFGDVMMCVKSFFVYKIPSDVSHEVMQEIDPDGGDEEDNPDYEVPGGAGCVSHSCATPTAAALTCASPNAAAFSQKTAQDVAALLQELKICDPSDWPSDKPTFYDINLKVIAQINQNLLSSEDFYVNSKKVNIYINGACLSQNTFYNKGKQLSIQRR